MRQSPVRLALFADGNTVAQRASHFSVIREIPDPVPPDPINTSADLILPVRLRLLLKEKSEWCWISQPAPTPQLSCRRSETSSYFYLKDSFIRTLKYFIFVLERRFDLGVTKTTLSQPGESISRHASIINRVTRHVQEKKCFPQAVEQKESKDVKLKFEDKKNLKYNQKKKKRFSDFHIVLLVIVLATVTDVIHQK